MVQGLSNVPIECIRSGQPNDGDGRRRQGRPADAGPARAPQVEGQPVARPRHLEALAKNRSRPLAVALALILAPCSLLLAPHAALAATCTVEGVGYTVTLTGSGTIAGTAWDDVILGSSGRDVVEGNGGDDVVCTLGRSSPMPGS